MNKLVLIDLEETRKRLEYYTQQMAKTSSKKSPVLKWVEIYTERSQKLERQASRLGLKTELQALKQKYPLSNSVRA